MSWHIKFRWHYFLARVWKIYYKEKFRTNDPDLVKGKEKWRHHVTRAVEIAQKHIKLKDKAA